MCSPTPCRASSTTGPVSGKSGKASMRRSTSRAYCFWIRPGLEPSQACAPEFGEDLRREGCASGATDAPEHLPGTLTFVWLPAVQGVDEQIREPERLRDGNRGSGPPGGCLRQTDRESLEEAQKLLCMAVWPSPERSANAKDGRLTRG
jgi:hypothetical protein